MPIQASQGAKTLCLHPIWMWDAANESFQLHHDHDIATSYRAGKLASYGYGMVKTAEDLYNHWILL